MKQIIQNYKTGEFKLVDVPTPSLKKNFVLVQNVSSLVSVGTEKYMIEMAKKSLLEKAKARPDLVKQVVAKLKTEGILETYKSVMARLDTPIPLGYSSAGIVVDVAPLEHDFYSTRREFNIGDRVACAGSGYASHAEIICVPINLCVHLPKRFVNRSLTKVTNNYLDYDYISFDEGAFVALGGIALEAIRLANPSLGDKIAVIGLGLLGQLVVQLLNSNGCHIFGIDVSEEKVKMARDNGCEEVAVSGKTDIINSARSFAPQGFDSVIIMAATKSNEPLELSAEIVREKGKIIVGGLVGLKIPRKIFFEKELELAVSRAWGPGVFDLSYTEKNIDYPYAYARWTAKRNMEEFLYQISKGNVDVNKLITHRFKIDDALKAYEMILKGKEPFLGVIIQYPYKQGLKDNVRSTNIVNVKYKTNVGKKNNHINKILTSKSIPCIGSIGAGLFATGTILPILKKIKNVRLKAVVTATGYKAQHVARKFGFEYFTTDYKEILNDKDINLVFIMTRHGSHAHFIVEVLKTGKHIFVEKPLCINMKQLQEIMMNFYAVGNELTKPILFVGFNRRFSPFASWIKSKFKQIKEPISVHITINAGYVPPNHWSHDPIDGGGRIIGEVCHFVDLIQYFTNSFPVEIFAHNLDSRGYKESDNVSITLKMQNGSIASILYIASGDKRYTRERAEIFGGGAVGIIENFKKAEFFYKGSKNKIKRWLGVDRGHKKEMEVLLSAVREGKSPVSFKEYIYTTLATFAIERSLKESRIIKIDELIRECGIDKLNKFK